MTAPMGGGELATEWVTILPETATLARRLREFKPAPIKVKVEADYGDMEREGQVSGTRTGQKIDSTVDRETRRTGSKAAHNIASGLDDKEITNTAQRVGRSIRDNIEGETRKIDFRSMGRGFFTGIGATAAGTMQILRNVSVISTILRVASRFAKALSISMLAASTATRVLTAGIAAKFGVGLAFAAKQANRLARQVARVTSAVLVAAAAIKLLQIMHTAAKWAGILTIGMSALLGVGAALVTSMGSFLVPIILSVGSALGIAAGAAAGLLGPMLGVAKIGFKGMSEGAKALQKDWKDVDAAFYKTIGERMRPMLEAWHNLSNGITDSMTQAMLPSFGNLGTLMDRMGPKTKMLAGTFGDLSNEITRGLLGPSATDSLNKMFDASNRFFRSFLGESGLTGATTGLLAFASTAADTFSGTGTKLNDLLLKLGEFLRGITPAQMKMVFATLQTQITNVWNVIKPILKGIRDLGAVSAPALAPGFKAVGDAIAQATPGLVNMAKIIMPALSKVMENLAPALPALIAAFTPWSQILAVIAPIVAKLVADLAPFAPIILAVATAVKVATIAMALYNTAMLLYSNAGRIATAVQWAWNTAMAANPIGAVIVAIAAVVAGLTLFFTKTETGRKLWDKIWTGMKNTVSTVWNWLKVEGGKLWESMKPALQSLWQTVQEVFGKLKAAFVELWPKIQPVVEAIAKVGLAIQKWNWTVVINALKILGTTIGWLVTNVAVPYFKMLIQQAQNLWTGLKAVFGFIKGAWEVLWFGVQVAWKIGEAVFNAVGAVLSAVWNGVLSPIFEQLKTVWDFLVSKLQWFGDVWNTIWSSLQAGVQAVWDFLKPVRDWLGSFFDSIGAIGGKAADAIKTAWSGLTGILKEPLHAIGRFLQGLPDSVLGISIPFVGDLKSWGASLAGLQAGGVIKGPGTGTSDSILGLNSRGVPTARVSNGEGVVPADRLDTPIGQMLFKLLLADVPALSGGGVPGSSTGGSGLNPGAQYLSDLIKKMFGVKDIGGRRSEDGYGEHSSGNAIDIMVPGDKALGDRIAGFLVTNKDVLGLDGMIWQQRSYGYGGGFDGTPMKDRGSPTQNHMDHIHAILGKGRGVNAAAVGLPTGPLIDAQGTSVMGTSTVPGSAGSAGGTGGSYVVDPKKVREGEDKVTDATNALDIKQQKLDEYLAKQAAGDKINESTISAARDAVTKQSRELEQAKTDLETVKQGTWKEGKPADKAASGKSDDWNSVGGMIFNGFLESMGFDGSVFKNLFETPNVKSGMAALNWGLGLLAPKDGENAGAGAPQDLGLGGPGGLNAGMDMLAGIGDQAGFNFPAVAQGAPGAPGPGNQAPVFDLRGSQLGVSPGAFDDKMGEMTAANKRHPTLGPT